MIGEYHRRPYYMAYGAIALHFRDKLWMSQDANISFVQAITNVSYEDSRVLVSDANNIFTQLKNNNYKNFIDLKDYSKLFFNFGKCSLDVLFKTAIKRNTYTHPAESNVIGDTVDNIGNIMSGIVKTMDADSLIAMKQFVSKFDGENPREVNSPIIPIGDLAAKLDKNDAEFISVMTTGIYYTLVGFALNYMNDHQVKTFFKYGESPSFKDNQLSKYVLKDEFIPKSVSRNFMHLTAMFTELVGFIERNTGFKLNDRFTKAFVTLGSATRKVLAKDAGILTNNFTEKYFLKFVPAPDNYGPIQMLEGILGVTIDHVDKVPGNFYYLRSLYSHLNSKGYVPIFATLSFDDLMHHEQRIHEDPCSTWLSDGDVLNVTQYERLVRVSIVYHNEIKDNDISDVEFIKLKYKILYIDKLISDLRKRYLSNATVEHVITQKEWFMFRADRSTGTDRIVSTSEMPHSMARATATDEIEGIDARYFEHFAYTMIPKDHPKYNSTIDIIVKYYSKKSKINLGVEESLYANLEDAINDWRTDIVPYAISLGDRDEKDLIAYYRGKVPNDVNLNKFNAIDISHSGGVGSVRRTPVEVMESDHFIKELSPTLANVLRETFKNMSNEEIVKFIVNK